MNKRFWAIQEANKKRWTKWAAENDADLHDAPGIYILARRDENGFKYAYVGQAKKVLSRLAQHLSGYQHIDLSLKAHKLYSAENPSGWDVYCVEYCSEEELNDAERDYIKLMADKGYQLLNKTSGGQNAGKTAISEQKSPKGYYDGKKQGYKDAQKFVAHLFDLYLKAEIKGKNTLNAQKALQKFYDFIGGTEKC
jgi:hypothetical protein